MRIIFKKIFIPILTLLLSWGGGQAWAASGEWTLTLTVSTPYSTVPGGLVSTSLAAGVTAGGTRGYDNAADTVSFMEPDDPLLAHFPHGAILKEANGAIQGWDCPEPETGYNAYQCSLWRDFRPLSDTETWRFEVVSPVNGTSVSLDWKIEGDPEILSKMDLTLVDLGLSAAPPFPPDLNRPSHYVYTNIFLPGKTYGLRTFEIRMKSSAPIILPSTLPVGTLNAFYDRTLQLVGGNGMWSLEGGTLPPGLRLDPSSGQISGFPLSEGSFTFTVRSDNPISGTFVSREFSIAVNPSLIIATPELPGGEIRAAYSQTLAATGGTPPYAWSLSAGSLPEGVSLDPKTGSLSGIFLLPGIFDFTLQVEDSVQARTGQTYRVVVTEPSDQGAPSAVSDLRALYTTAAAAILAWSAPVDDSLTGTAAAYDLRYSPNCPGTLDPAWWDAALQASGEPRPQTDVFHTYTLNGLEAGKIYCAAVKSVDASGHLSAISNGIVFPDLLTPGGAASAAPVTLQVTLAPGYNLLSVPLLPLANDLSIFEDDVGTPAALYRWYTAYPELIPPEWHLESGVQPGRAYFLYVPESATVVDVTGLEIGDSETIVRLQGGWNMVGNPYGSDLPLKDVRIREVRDDGSEAIKPFEEASKAGWVGNALYAFTGLGYEFLAVNDDPPAVLKPWRGFWLNAREDGHYEMIFPKP